MFAKSTFAACAIMAISKTNNMSVEKLILRPPNIKNFIISIYSSNLDCVIDILIKLYLLEYIEVNMSEYQNISKMEEDLIKQYLPERNKIEELSKFYFAFADSTRLKIIMSLCIMPMCVTDLANILHLNQSTLSHQLQLLKSYNIVKSERCKKNITYSVTTEYVEKIIECGVDAKVV